MAKTSPTPWRVVTHDDSDECDIYSAQGTPVCTMSHFPDSPEADAALIVEAVNGKDEAEAPAPLPFGMVEARDESNRRYQETHQEFWAGLADLLADGAAMAQYHDADRVKIDRLRDLVRRLADSLGVAVDALRASVFYPTPPLDTPHVHLNGVDITALLREAREATGEAQ